MRALRYTSFIRFHFLKVILPRELGMSKQKFLTEFNMLDTRDLAGRLKPAIELTITSRLFPPAQLSSAHCMAFYTLLPFPAVSLSWCRIGIG